MYGKLSSEEKRVNLKPVGEEVIVEPHVSVWLRSLETSAVEGSPVVLISLGMERKDHRTAVIVDGWSVCNAEIESDGVDEKERGLHHGCRLWLNDWTEAHCFASRSENKEISRNWIFYVFIFVFFFEMFIQLYRASGLSGMERAANLIERPKTN